jgi:hypothetical protein
LLPTTVSLRRVRIAEELDDESLLALAQLWLNRANDAFAAVDRDSISDSERRVAVEVACRDHLVAAPELVAVTERSH